MRRIIFSLLFSIIVLDTIGQEILTAKNNMYRPDDELTKKQILYKELGRSGQNVLWNLGEIETIDDSYSVIYSDRNLRIGTISGTEHKTRYYYELRNDSLLISGFENNTTLIVNNLPEVALRFPMQYGDSIDGVFHGKGIYCDKFRLRMFGTYKNKIDAIGMLILPGEDTLRHVIRVCSDRKIANITYPLDSCELDNANYDFGEDSIRYYISTNLPLIQMRTYTWYAAGYRYPVLETTTITEAGSDIYTSSFYCPQEEQSHLAYDYDNQLVREELIRHGGNSYDSTSGDMGFTYNIYQVGSSNQLKFEYELKKSAGFSYGIYGIDGTAYYYQPEIQQSCGVYSCVIDLGSNPTGIYILDMHVGDRQYTEKLIIR